MSTISLPTVDLSLFHSPLTRPRFVADLRAMLYDHGFFYLTGHSVDPALTRRVLDVARQFFALPDEEKLAIEMVKSPHFRGYNRVGFELTGGKKDWREQVDFDTDRPALPIRHDDAPWKRAIGPNQWPPALPEMREVITAYQAEVTRVGRAVLKAIAVAINEPEDTFEPMFEPHPAQHMKIVRYPGDDRVENQQGVGSHKDGGLITILLNDHHPGLMVQSSSGEWIDAPPIEGSFIVNTGELLEMITDGFVRADVHRVITPPAGVSRYSVPFFLGANLLAPLPQLRVTGDLKRAVRGITKDPANPLFHDVGTNHLKARIRSHPDVARAHYHDVELGPGGFEFI
ncbi:MULTISPECIES: isopenicillin N synthase family oxygenase [unclassified Burkholderia]|uniref:isopenicillin N synthase family dioxygenase n=1 Tax=unclassified Burkholderia TaxID=2613784 RepID=UPI000F5822DF|nr:MULTISPECIES: 2-oxoglutarate and iron-dependent oxygenase domain-containing protein [unclassified Burkholderia]RQR40726.1 isopenicillin N synthase family oxygenase [Burkholderia sp. Bp9142]RQR45394.1 isopenicillin N synthase family oxygenase [Burkholderia sp. Bp9140]